MLAIGIFLTPVDLSYFAIALIISGFGLAAFPLGQEMAIVRQANLTVRYVLLCIAQSLLLGASFLLLLGIAQFFYPAADWPAPATIVVLGLLIGISDCLFQILIGAAQNKLRYKNIELTTITRNSLIFLFTIGALLISPRIEIALAARLCAGLAGLVMIFMVAIRKLPVSEPGLRFPVWSPLAFDMLSKNVVNFFSRNADIVAAGPQLGVANLGYYDFSRRIVAQPRDLLASVLFRFAYPLFSRLALIENPKVRAKVFRRIYAEMVSVAAKLGFPFFVLLLIVGPDLIINVLGPDWADAVPVFQIFAATALFQLLGNGLVSSALTANDQSRFVMVVETATVPPRFILLFFVSFYGLIPVALANAAFIVVKLAYMQHELIRKTAINYKGLARAIGRPTIAVTCAAIAAFVISMLLDGFWLWTVSATSAVFCIVYAAFLAPDIRAMVRSARSATGR